MKRLHALGVSVLLATWLGAGCGGGSKGPGQQPGSGGAAGATGSGGNGGQIGNGGSAASSNPDPIECGVPGASCETGSDCCSGLCAAVASDGGAGASGSGTAMGSVCVRGSGSTSECLPGGYSCSSNLDCCTANCVDGHCRDTACIEDNQACSPGGDACCSGECVDGTCADINGGRECKVSGNSCESDGECCSKLCQNGKCFARSSYCTQSGDTCTADTDCCEGICDKSSGLNHGFCTRPNTSGNTGCNANELLAGEVCGADCSQCCSRSCAPNRLGVFICQLSGGCRTSGEVCTQDTDCCGGSALEGLPGAQSNQPAKCVKRDPDDVYGQCRSGGGCRPRGDTCQIDLGSGEGASCMGSSSKPSNCCPLGDSVHGECGLDALFVPRCGLDAECRTEGQTCASSADCCDHHPCVPDEQGVFRCGSECIDQGGGCTVDADCCVGTLCIVPPGSVRGTCGASEPPGGTGGGGNTGGSSNDGGSTSSGGNGNECIPYGQTCQATSDCCNTDAGITCNGGRCVIVVR